MKFRLFWTNKQGATCTTILEANSQYAALKQFADALPSTTLTTIEDLIR